MKRIMIVGAVALLVSLGAGALAMVMPGREGPPPEGTGGRQPFHPPGHELKDIEQAYEKELRAAQEQIAESRRVLDENTSRLREIWDQAREASGADARADLRPEFEGLVKENSRLEIEVAELKVKVAEMGLKLAMERLVQARVSLREAQIKLHRRERWLEGDWGDRLRRGPYEPRRDRPADAPTADQPSSNGPAADEPAADQPSDDKPSDDKPSDEEPSDDEPAVDQPAANEQDASRDEPAVQAH